MEATDYPASSLNVETDDFLIAQDKRHHIQFLENDSRVNVEIQKYNSDNAKDVLLDCYKKENKILKQTIRQLESAANIVPYNDYFTQAVLGKESCTGVQTSSTSNRSRDCDHDHDHVDNRFNRSELYGPVNESEMEGGQWQHLDSDVNVDNDSNSFQSVDENMTIPIITSVVGGSETLVIDVDDDEESHDDEDEESDGGDVVIEGQFFVERELVGRPGAWNSNSREPQPKRQRVTTEQEPEEMEPELQPVQFLMEHLDAKLSLIENRWMRTVKSLIVANIKETLPVEKLFNKFPSVEILSIGPDVSTDWTTVTETSSTIRLRGITIHTSGFAMGTSLRNNFGKFATRHLPHLKSVTLIGRLCLCSSGTIFDDDITFPCRWLQYCKIKLTKLHMQEAHFCESEQHVAKDLACIAALDLSHVESFRLPLYKHGVFPHSCFLKFELFYQKLESLESFDISGIHFHKSDAIVYLAAMEHLKHLWVNESAIRGFKFFIRYANLESISIIKSPIISQCNGSDLMSFTKTTTRSSHFWNGDLTKCKLEHLRTLVLDVHESSLYPLHLLELFPALSDVTLNCFENPSNGLISFFSAMLHNHNLVQNPRSVNSYLRRLTISGERLVEFLHFFFCLDVFINMEYVSLRNLSSVSFPIPEEMIDCFNNELPKLKELHLKNIVLNSQIIRPSISVKLEN